MHNQDETALHAWDAHVYVKAIKGAFGFSIFQRTINDTVNTETKLARVATGRLPLATDNYAATLTAIEAALLHAKQINKRSAPRSVHVHTDENSVFHCSKGLAQWRESGVYFNREGGQLPKETEWRAVVAAGGELELNFEFAKKGSMERVKIYQVALNIRGNTPAEAA